MGTRAEREAIEQAIRLLLAAKRRDGERHLRSRKMRAIRRHEWNEALGLMARPNRRPAVARWFDGGKLSAAELSALLGSWLFCNGSERIDPT